MEVDLNTKTIIVDNDKTFCDGCGSKIQNEKIAYTKKHSFYEKTQLFCCVECRDKPEQGC